MATAERKAVDYKVAQAQMQPTAVGGDVAVDKDVPYTGVTNEQLGGAKERCALPLAFLLAFYHSSPAFCTLLEVCALCCHECAAMTACGWQADHGLRSCFGAFAARCVQDAFCKLPLHCCAYV